MIVQRINSERLVVLGWSRAILLQVAHPLIAAGVTSHSAFRGSALQAAVRLHHTVSAMLALMFGTPAARAGAVANIRAIHDRVHGTLSSAAGPFPAGTAYSAHDPALLLWVHATLLESTADIYQRLIAPLSPGELDTLTADAAPLLLELGGDPATAPRTWSALQQYMRTMYDSGALFITDEARTLGEAVLSPRAAGMVVPLSGVQQLVTIGLLPPAIREAYGFAWSEARQRRFGRAIHLLRAARRVTPRVVAQWRMARRLA